MLTGRCDACPLLSAWVATRAHLHAPHLGVAGWSRPELVEEPSAWEGSRVVTLPGQASGHACIPWAIPCTAVLFSQASLYTRTYSWSGPPLWY